MKRLYTPTHLIALFMTLAVVNCPEPKKTDTTSTLLPLLFSSGSSGFNSSSTSSTSSDSSSSSSSITISSVYHSSSFATNRLTPGATISITGTGFSSTLSQNSVTVSGTSATVTSATTTEVKFTMPDLTSITENQTVTLVLTSNSKTASTSITYYPTPTIPVNATNSLNRTLTASGFAANHWYKFTTTGTTNIINTSGYTGRDIDFTVYASANASSSTTAATGTATNAELLRTTTLSASTTYFLQVRIYSGSSTAYRIGIASQAISNGSCSLHTASSRCLDYLISDTAAENDCTGGGGSWNASTSCSARGLGTVVGRCTFPSATNIATTSYYSNGGAAFSAGSAQTNCNTVSNSIFQ